GDQGCQSARHSKNLLTSVVTSRIVTNKKGLIFETRNVFKFLICNDNLVVANQGLEPRTCGMIDSNSKFT
ncbi:MAG: hypothetical protein EBU79_14195, partial [Betaproteobacteria bacterium]|nr:hypothetical protein [Betaproteobacteria bacterium]